MRAIKNIFFGYCCLITASEYAQNLVPNSSFETYTTCPTGGSQIYDAVPWTGPTTNSVEYYNVCSSTYTIPFNGMYPHMGNGMAGLWGLDGFGMNYREYLQVKLSDTLKSNKCYYVEFYIALYRGLKYAINNMGAYFTNQLFTTSLPASSAIVLNYVPNILKFTNPIIKDTLNWTKISGIYRANGTESYITIGNFQDDAQTDTLNTNYGMYGGAYYFVDDVNVVPTDSMSLPPFAGNDTTIAIGDSVFIGRQLYGLNCNWYCNNILIDTNISGIWVKPTTTTKYVVEQNLCSNTGYDTVTVSISTVGIKKYADKSGISVYPNPANEKIFIEQAKNEEIIGVVVADVYGKDVLKTSKQTEIDISSLAAGVYFIQVNTKNNISTQKLVIRH
jgi:hypothetical protein